MNKDGDFRAFGDESSALRPEGMQVYSVCAALLPSGDLDAVRDELAGLRLPGQAKVHWRDETSRRRRRIVDAIRSVGPMNVIVTHTGATRRQAERYRRLCLEQLYWELWSMEVYDLAFESRREVQDKRDRAHLVNLQSSGKFPGMVLSHVPGREDPLLWIADAVLGAMTASSHGEHGYQADLEETILVSVTTPSSDLD